MKIGGEEIEASKKRIVLFELFDQVVVLVVWVGFEEGEPSVELAFGLFEHEEGLFVCAKVAVAKGVSGGSEGAKGLDRLEEDVAAKSGRCCRPKVGAFGRIEQNTCGFCEEEKAVPSVGDLVGGMPGGGEDGERQASEGGDFFGGYEFFGRDGS